MNEGSQIPVPQDFRSLSRRRMLQVGCAALPGLLTPRAWGLEPGDDVLQQWLKRTAVAADPASSEDFSPAALEGVLSSIGDARVVLLGEPSHGSGAAFRAKVRLVRLLHERLGFDVLAWESGFIDLERTEAGLRSGMDPVQAAQQGILKIWSASAECRPLFVYAQESHRGKKPLTMAGFDMQLTAAGTLEYFARELRAFVAKFPARLGAAPVAEQFLESFGRLNRYTDALAAKLDELGRSGVNGAARGAAIGAWNKSEGDSIRPVAPDLEALQKAAAALEPMLGEGSPAERAGFMVQAVRGLTAYGANLLEDQGKHTAEQEAIYAVGRENRRDQANAENLRWMIDKEYAGRKIMVWAHNAHVMNAWYGPHFDSISLAPLQGGMKTTGAWLTGWYGRQVYKVGLTAYQGHEAMVGSGAAPVPAAPVGSLEERMHRLGFAEAFLPLRPGNGGKRCPVSPVEMRIPKFKEESVEDPAQAFDALYFIDTMTPATSIG